jgi:hypothetical protein
VNEKLEPSSDVFLNVLGNILEGEHEDDEKEEQKEMPHRERFEISHTPTRQRMPIAPGTSSCYRHMLCCCMDSDSPNG